MDAIVISTDVLAKVRMRYQLHQQLQKEIAEKQEMCNSIGDSITALLAQDTKLDLFDPSNTYNLDIERGLLVPVQSSNPGEGNTAAAPTSEPRAEVSVPQEQTTIVQEPVVTDAPAA